MNLDLERLLNMASGAEEAIRRRFDDLPKLEAQLEALDGQMCTGREYWRDKDEREKEAKLYIIHSVDEACPIHGQPEPGKRLRVYVGSKASRIREARHAIQREVERQELKSQLSQLQRGLDSCGYYLQQFYDRLYYRVDGDGHVEPR